MVAHSADGFGLGFTSRNSWKARLFKAGKEIDVVPITWTHARRRNGQVIYQEVWYRDVNELEQQRASGEPFTIALALAKDPNAHPKTFQSFQGVFRVKATGVRLSEQSIEAEILGRRRAADE